MTAKKTILVLNGPGLADLGDYDTRLFGRLSLDDIREDCAALCKSIDIELDFRQSDEEDEMFRWIARDSVDVDGVIINPAGHSLATTVTFELYHSAIQLIAHLDKPIIEVHIANIFHRNAETSRRLHESAANMGFICGLGKQGYLLAIKSFAQRFSLEKAA
jgi:3-dehydroquinate dehydratase-2